MPTSSIDHNQIRRKILSTLYEKFRQEPKTPWLSKIDIGVDHEIPTADINWNIQYLCDKGFVEQSIVNLRMGSVVSDKYKITSYGIDIIEDPSEFNQAFPTSVQINITVDQLRMIFNDVVESASLPPEEKSGIIEEFNKFMSHPVAANMVSTMLLKMMGM